MGGTHKVLRCMLQSAGCFEEKHFTTELQAEQASFVMELHFYWKKSTWNTDCDYSNMNI